MSDNIKTLLTESYRAMGKAKPKKKPKGNMIRPMTAQDIPVLIDMGAAMHKESRYAKLDFDPGKLRDLGETILGNPEAWLVLVAERDGGIIGFCIGYVAPHFFGNDLTSGDLAIYVMPEHRGGTIGARLVKLYTSWCEAQGRQGTYARCVGGHHAGADRAAIRAAWIH
jgi:GNAT superfamily N-acetyltransferase